jgi:APA family basic amino acid/polyamine antiporter
LEVAKDAAARELLAQTHPELVAGTQGFMDALKAIMSSPSDAILVRAHELLAAPQLFGVEIGFNLPAFLIALAITWILVVGIKESAKFNAGIVIVKVSVVLFVLALGSHYVHPANWGHDWHSFAPFGFAGIGAAAGYIFFAYIGFDAVSTTAQEAKNPQRDLPIGIIVSLFICTLLYVGVAAVLTGMVPWQLVNIGAPLTHAFLDHNIGWASDIITCGALAGLTSVMLVMLIGQTRVLYAMASDGLLPKKFFGAVHPKFHTPWKNTILVGLLAAVVGSVTPIDKIGKMVNIGTLLAFVMVCASIVVLRIKEPNQPRPFRTPGIYFGGWLPVVPVLGIVANGYLMYSLGWENWARLFIWLGIGLVVYFTYSVKHSKVQALPSSTQGL